MELFKSKIVAGAEVVKAKLQAAQEHHALLIASQPQLALDAVLEQDGAAERLKAHEAQIADSEKAIATLQLALREAERLEAERRHQVRVDADKSRCRALAQHLSSLRTAAASYERNLAEVGQSWEQMKDAARRASKLLTGAEQTAIGLHPSHLKRLCEQEMTRQAWPKHPLEMGPHVLPGAKPQPIRVELPTLTETIASLADALADETAGRGVPDAV
jgi:hypothetical protein